MRPFSMRVCLSLPLIAAACDEEPEGPRVTVHACTADGSTSSSRVDFYDPDHFLVGQYQITGNTDTVSNPMPIGGSVELRLSSGGDGSGNYSAYRFGALDGVSDGDELDFRHYAPIPEICRVREIPEVTVGPSWISWSDRDADLVDARVITVTFASEPPTPYFRAKDITVDRSTTTSATVSVPTPTAEVTVTVVECDGAVFDDIKPALARRAALGC